MVELLGAGKRIKGKQILSDINLTLEKGKLYGLEGANGSGKTMLLRMMCGLIKPSEGQVRISKNTTFGVLIETPGFIFNESAYSNLKYLADINKTIGKAEIENILKRIGLYESRDVKTKKFSLGMLQKLSIVQAVMENPDVILLDEPFNALDEESIEIVKEMIIEQKEKGASIVIASHTLDYLREQCDAVYKMTDGKLSEK